jgi:ankyrin repeat protein
MKTPPIKEDQRMNRTHNVRMQILAAAATLLVLADCRDSESQTVTEQQTDIPSERVAPPDVSLPDAAWAGDIEAVKQHIAAGSDLNQKNASGTTPIENAATSGRPSSKS